MQQGGGQYRFGDRALPPGITDAILQREVLREGPRPWWAPLQQQLLGLPRDGGDPQVFGGVRLY